MKRIGFIGYGLRSETMLKAFRALEADICVAAVADPRHAQIAPERRTTPTLPKHAGMRTRRRLLAPRRSGRRVHRHALPAAYAAGLPGC